MDEVELDDVRREALRRWCQDEQVRRRGRYGSGGMSPSMGSPSTIPTWVKEGVDAVIDVLRRRA